MISQEPIQFSCKVSIAGFTPITIGSRFRAARMQARKSAVEVAAALSFAHESQYLEMENGQSGMEKYGCMVGRLAVRFGTSVGSLLDGAAFGSTASNETKDASASPVEKRQEALILAATRDIKVGPRLRELRIQLALTVADVCNFLTIGGALDLKGMPSFDFEGATALRRQSMAPSTLSTGDASAQVSEKQDENADSIMEEDGDAQPSEGSSSHGAESAVPSNSSTPTTSSIGNAPATFFVSERELILIESGAHSTFERWMRVLFQFCVITQTDAFSLVLGL